MAAWARAVGLRLVIEVIGSEDERIAALLTPETARIAHAIDSLGDADRLTVGAIVERLAQE